MATTNWEPLTQEQRDLWAKTMWKAARESSLERTLKRFADYGLDIKEKPKKVYRDDGVI